MAHPNTSDTSILHGSWVSHALHTETLFEVDTDFRSHAHTRTAVHDFILRGLESLFRPTHILTHERQVRLFYQNLVVDHSILSTTVDGVSFPITDEDISFASGCPLESPLLPSGLPRFSPYPADISLHTIIAEMCERRYGDRHRNCTTRALLPPHLWFTDTVIQRNVCPIGHKTQRRGDFLEVLYAFHRGYWISIPSVIRGQMTKVWDRLVRRQMRSAEAIRLPFSSLVSALLLAKGVFPTEADEITELCPTFGISQWNHSVSHMQQLPHVVAARAGRDERPDERPEERPDQRARDEPAEETAEQGVAEEEIPAPATAMEEDVAPGPSEVPGPAEERHTPDEAYTAISGRLASIEISIDVVQRTADELGYQIAEVEEATLRDIADLQRDIRYLTELEEARVRDIADLRGDIRYLTGMMEAFFRGGPPPPPQT